MSTVTERTERGEDVENGSLSGRRRPIFVEWQEDEWCSGEMLVVYFESAFINGPSNFVLRTECFAQEGMSYKEDS